jgi:hypothetical protein
MSLPWNPLAKPLSHLILLVERLTFGLAKKSKSEERKKPCIESHPDLSLRRAC